MTPSVEIPKEQPLNIQKFLEKMSVAVEDGQDAVTYMKNEALTFTRNQWKELNDRFLANINLPENLQLKMNRDAILAFTSSQLSSFRAQVNAFIGSIPAPSAETKKNLILGGLGVAATGAIAAIGYGIYRVFRGTKEVIGTGIEKAKKGIGWLGKTLLIGGAVTIAGAALYFGKDDISNYFQSLAEAKMKEGKDAAEKKVTELKEAAQVEIQSAKEDALEKIAETRNSAEEKLAEAQESVKKGLEKTEPFLAETREKAGTAADATVDAATSPEGKQVMENLAGDVLQKVINVKAPTVYKAMIASEWTVGDVKDLYDPVTRDVKNTDDPRILALIPEDTPQEECPLFIEATRKLVVMMAQGVHLGNIAPETPIADIAATMLHKHQKVAAILDQMKQGDYSNVNMESFFSEIRGESSRLTESLKDSMPSDFQLPPELSHLSLWTIHETVMTNIHTNEMTSDFINRERKNIDALQVDIQAKKDKEKVQEKILADVFSQWEEQDAREQNELDPTVQADRATETQRLQEQVASAKKERETAESKLALVYILEYISKSGEALVPLFHRVLPDKEFNTERTPEAKQENIDAVNRYLSGSDVGQMFRFFEYRCLMEDEESPIEQVAALMWQQTEIFQLIGERDTGHKGWESGFGTVDLKLKMKTSIANLGTDVLTDSDEFSTALKVLGLSEIAIKEAYEKLREPALELSKGALKKLGAPTMDVYEALVVLKDALPLTAKISAIGVGAFLARRKVLRPAHAIHAFFTKWRPERAVEAMSDISKKWGLSRSTLTYRLSSLHHKDVDRGLELLKKLQQSSAESGEKGLQMLEDWMKNGGANQKYVQPELIAPIEAELLAVNREVASAAKKVTSPQLCADILDGTISAESEATRVATRLGQSPDDAIALLRAVQRESRYKGFLKDASALLDPENANAVRAIARTVRSVREAAKQFYLVQHMQQAGLGKSLFWLGGAAVTGYDAYSEFGAYSDVKKEKTEAIALLENQMKIMIEELQQSGQYEEKKGSFGVEDRVFVHKTIPGIEVHLKVKVPDNARDALETVYGDRQEGHLAKGLTSAVSAISLLGMGPKMAMGPIGVAVAAVEVSVRLGVAAHEQSKMREFISSAPPWLLASIGTSPTNISEHQWLVNASSWMLSDAITPTALIAGVPGIFLESTLSESNSLHKTEIVQKVIFAVLMTDLRSSAPQIFLEMSGMQSPEEIDKFYSGDFQNIVLPLVSRALMSQTDMSKENAETIDISSGLLAPARATMMDIQRATRTAAVLYREHLHEKEYYHLRNETKKDIAASQSDDMRDVLEEVLQELGKRKVFGKAVSEVALSDDSEKNTTTIERLLEGIKDTNHPDIPASSFTLAGVAAFLETPEERSALLDGIAVSPQEQGTKTGIQKSVQANISALSQFATQETGLSTVNGIRALRGEPAILSPMTDQDYKDFISAEIPKILDIGRVTLDQSRSSAEGTLVYTDLQAHRMIDQFVAAPPSRGVDTAGYYRSLAICHQGQILGGKPYALSTFISGNPETWDTPHPDLYIRQSACAGGSRQSEGDREKIHTGYIRGGDVMVSVEDFLQQKGAKDLLDRIKKDWTNKQAKDQEAITAEKMRQENARERSNSGTGTFTQVPSTQGKGNGELQMQFHGNTVIYRPESIPETIMSEGGSRWGFKMPIPDRAFRVEVVYPNGQPSQTYTLSNIRQLATEASGDHKDKEFWYDLLSTPNDNDPGEAIDRILNISPFRNQFSGEPKFILPAFKKVVLPMYEKCTNKKGFLRILIRGIAEKGEINRELLRSLPNMLQQVL